MVKAKVSNSLFNLLCVLYCCAFAGEFVVCVALSFVFVFVLLLLLVLLSASVCMCLGFFGKFGFSHKLLFWSICFCESQNTSDYGQGTHLELILQCWLTSILYKKRLPREPA